MLVQQACLLLGWVQAVLIRFLHTEVYSFTGRKKRKCPPSLALDNIRSVPLFASPYLKSGAALGERQQTCQFHRPNLSGLRAVSIYEEPLRGCIHALKYDGNTRLAFPLGLLLAQAFRRYAVRADLIIPVPLEQTAKAAWL